MIIKKIAQLCKKRKKAYIHSIHDEKWNVTTQYIGDGFALYPAGSLPKVDKDILLTIFDVPEKNRDDWFVVDEKMPDGIDVSNIAVGEKIVERKDILLTYADRTLVPLLTSKGMVFIQSKYLSPLADVLDVMELYERTSPDGQMYIVAKAGLLFQAVIMPYKLINEKFIEGLRHLTEECERTLIYENAHRSGYELDSETGEILGDSEAETD